MIYIKLLSLLLCLLFINCQKQGKPFEESKIVGSRPARVWTFPYMASIENYTSHLGSATILSSLWLAAPAHIFAYEYWYNGLENIKKTMRLRIGTSYILRGGYLYYIQNMTFYPTFVNASLINDLVLIMTSVAMAIPNRNMKSITIHDFYWVPKQGDMLRISGWGATKEKWIRRYLLPIL